MAQTDNNESTPDLAPVQWSRRSLLAAAWAVGILVMAIIGVAFRSSWVAGKDAALSIRLDEASADLYMIGVDGVIVVAAAVMFLLRHVTKVRRWCFGVILMYTLASLVINVLHGFEVFDVDPATGERPLPAWPVTVLVASLAVSTIAVGTHLLVMLMLHLSPAIAKAKRRPRPPKPPADKPAPKPERPVPAPTGDDSEGRRKATAECLAALHAGKDMLGQKSLGKKHGISHRQAGYAQADARNAFAAASNGSPQ